jgi:hypothetical protein
VSDDVLVVIGGLVPPVTPDPKLVIMSMMTAMVVPTKDYTEIAQPPVVLVEKLVSVVLGVIVPPKNHNLSDVTVETMIVMVVSMKTGLKKDIPAMLALELVEMLVSIFVIPEVLVSPVEEHPNFLWLKFVMALMMIVMAKSMKIGQPKDVLVVLEQVLANKKELMSVNLTKVAFNVLPPVALLAPKFAMA